MICDYCGTTETYGNSKESCSSKVVDKGTRHYWVESTVLPAGQGNRTQLRHRHDLIPLEFLDELASIFEEGLQKYGDSWKKGGRDFLIDCLNHASNHLHKYCNGDISENQLSKVAWNALVVRYFDLKGDGLNGNTRHRTEEVDLQDVREGPTSPRDDKRDVQCSAQSVPELVDRPGIGTPTQEKCPGDVVPNPQRNFGGFGGVSQKPKR